MSCASSALAMTLRCRAKAHLWTWLFAPRLKPGVSDGLHGVGMRTLTFFRLKPGVSDGLHGGMGILTFCLLAEAWG